MWISMYLTPVTTTSTLFDSGFSLFRLPERHGMNSRVNLQSKNKLIRAGRFRIQAALERRVKERDLDDVILRQKKYKLVSTMMDIIVQHPRKTMPIRTLHKHHKRLGLEKERQLLPILRRFSIIFRVLEDPDTPTQYLCGLTPFAESLLYEEARIHSKIEDTLVYSLRKLLMMSHSKRILLDKIGILAREMGLPLDFKTGVCRRYPQYFRVVETDYGPALELTSWDPSLAVAFAEENGHYDGEEEKLIVNRPRKFKKINMPNGFRFSRKELKFIDEFYDLPFISPYSDHSKLDPNSLEAEKRDCTVIHEMLSLTQEKKLPVISVTPFKHEFKFFHRIRLLVLRHPDMFYMSFRGGGHTIFLKEAYRGNQLKKKGLLVHHKEKLQNIISRKNKHGQPVNMVCEGDLEPVSEEDYLSDVPSDDDYIKEIEENYDFSDCDEIRPEMGYFKSLTKNELTHMKSGLTSESW